MGAAWRVELTGKWLVGEDAIEGRAGDAKLACGAEFVAMVKAKDVLDVAADDGVEEEGGGRRRSDGS